MTDQLLQHFWLPADWSDLNVAVALSGGADSMALLRLMMQLKQKQGGAGELFALHVNHRLRGAESDEDAQWCQLQCDKLGIPLNVLTGNLSLDAEDLSHGVEAAARQQRYQLLTTAAEQAGVRYLAMAHTRDDQVETVVFRTLRGTGLRGMKGIPQVRELTESLSLIRPLLECSRMLLIDYLAELGQDYRTDSSNADSQFTRNRIRLELLPLLRRQYNEDLDSAILRLANHAEEAQRLVEQLAGGLVEQARCESDQSSITFFCQPFQEQEPMVVREAIRLIWREARLPEQAMTHQWWTQLAAIALNPDEKQVYNLPGNVHASITGDRLTLAW